MRSLALSLLVALTGCLGAIRESTTARTAREQLLCTTAAQRAVASVDSSRFASRRVFIDVERLASQVDRGFVVDAFEQRVTEAGGLLAAAKDKADLVVEVRAAALGTYEGKWTIWWPMPYSTLISPNAPTLLEIGYSLQEGWCRLDAFCYDRESGAYVAGWRQAWGRAYVGFFDDIYPEMTIAENVKARTD